MAVDLRVHIPPFDPEEPCAGCGARPFCECADSCSVYGARVEAREDAIRDVDFDIDAFFDLERD